MNKILCFLIIGLSLFCSMVICGCGHHQSKVEDTIRLMCSQKVRIPFETMSCWVNDSMQYSRPWENASMKLVVYTDSTQCSTCTLKHMSLWSDFVKLENKNNNSFQVICC